jgi:hypothetical protein
MAEIQTKVYTVSAQNEWMITCESFTRENRAKGLIWAKGKMYYNYDLTGFPSDNVCSAPNMPGSMALGQRNKGYGELDSGLAG